MWLLDVKTLELEEFIGDNIPAYCILSHTWGPEEVSFVEIKKPKYREIAKRKAGFSKVQGCCVQAEKDGFEWAWVDSCCIDKRSSAQLSEAINSMFQWYRRSGCCYVYLSDVPSGSEAIQMLKKSKWFTRGWTLQELLAPQDIIIFAQDWIPIGYKATQRGGEIPPISGVRGLGIEGHLFCPNLANELSTITNIPVEFLVGKRRIGQACVAQRMFWASRRRTTRAEDRAYSLMGLFDVSMPVLYGEGLDKAFTRLQCKILDWTRDQSILAWYRTHATSYRLLAESPDCFQNSGTVMQLGGKGLLTPEATMNWSSFSMTNLGLRVTLPITTAIERDKYDFGYRTEALLHCVVDNDSANPQRISLGLIFLNNDLEGYPIFMCYRSRQWTFSTGNGHPMSIFLCGNDYTSVQEGEKSIRPTSISEPRSVTARILDILAHELNLSHEDLGNESYFSQLGVDSLMLLVIIFRIREEMGLKITMQAFNRCLTIGHLIAYLTSAEIAILGSTSLL